MKKKFLIQGVTLDSHLKAVKRVLAIPNPDRAIVSVGFMNERGLVALEEVIAPIAKQTTIVAGIRNGITSVQGLRKCLEIGCVTYVVDTGSRDVLFHPKVYLSRNSSEARLVVGSANLTLGGLNSNVEASLYFEIDLSNKDDSLLFADIEAKIDRMIKEFPKNIFKVNSLAVLQELFDSGRLVDESERQSPGIVGTSRRRDLDFVPRMDLEKSSIAGFRPRPFGKGVGQGRRIQSPRAADSKVQGRPTLVWQSKELKRRHLTIPTGSKTNPTGSMLFGKGATDGIDQRHYFRDQVFAELDWQFDSQSRTKHFERAKGRFRLVICDIDYGVFTLRLSHNSRTDTKSYQQHNSMTHLHWGEARQLIAQEDLLGRTMYLYNDRMDRGLFVIEID